MVPRLLERPGLQRPWMICELPGGGARHGAGDGEDVGVAIVPTSWCKAWSRRGRGCLSSHRPHVAMTDHSCFGGTTVPRLLERSGLQRPWMVCELPGGGARHGAGEGEVV